MGLWGGHTVPPFQSHPTRPPPLFWDRGPTRALVSKGPARSGRLPGPTKVGRGAGTAREIIVERDPATPFGVRATGGAGGSWGHPTGHPKGPEDATTATNRTARGRAVCLNCCCGGAGRAATQRPLCPRGLIRQHRGRPQRRPRWPRPDAQLAAPVWPVITGDPLREGQIFVAAAAKGGGIGALKDRIWIWIWGPILRLTGRPAGARWRPRRLRTSVGHAPSDAVPGPSTDLLPVGALWRPQAPPPGGAGPRPAPPTAGLRGAADQEGPEGGGGLRHVKRGRVGRGVGHSGTSRWRGRGGRALLHVEGAWGGGGGGTEAR